MATLVSLSDIRTGHPASTPKGFVGEEAPTLSRKPLRRIPTPPPQESPPALPPRRTFSRPGPGNAVPVSSPSTSSTPPEVIPTPTTQTVHQPPTQTPSLQASSPIGTGTNVVFSGHPVPRMQVPAAVPPSSSPVVPPQPPPRAMVSIDSPHRHRAKPNEYVDSPHLVDIRPSPTSTNSIKKCKSYVRPQVRSSSQENLENAHRDRKLRNQSRSSGGRPQSPSSFSNNSSSSGNIISTQPVLSSGLKKPELTLSTSGSISPASDSSGPRIFSRTGPGRPLGDPFSQPADSVYCPTCHRCTCEKCMSPRNLPSDWICKKSCYCSPETVLDYASCMCCVKGYFYHCAKDADEDASCADDPCSCGPPRCASRWACMGLIAAALPCILCYLPLKGCIRMAEVCYNCCHRRGCRCGHTSANSRGLSRPFSAGEGPNSLQNSTSGNSSFNNSVGRGGSLPPSLSASSTAAILAGPGRGAAHPCKSNIPDLHGKFLLDADTTHC